MMIFDIFRYKKILGLSASLLALTLGAVTLWVEERIWVGVWFLLFCAASIVVTVAYFTKYKNSEFWKWFLFVCIVMIGLGCCALLWLHDFYPLKNVWMYIISTVLAAGMLFSDIWLNHSRDIF